MLEFKLRPIVLVPLPLAVFRSFVPLRSEMSAYFQLHQRLAKHSHSITEKVGIVVTLGLVDRVRQCHPQIVGHRVSPRSRMFRQLTD